MLCVCMSISVLLSENGGSILFMFIHVVWSTAQNLTCVIHVVWSVNCPKPQGLLGSVLCKFGFKFCFILKC